MNISGHRNDNIKALVTPTIPTSTMGLSTNDELPISYGSEVDPVFDAWLDNPTGLTKTHVGLSNVDNTSDVNKPLSTATTNALALKQSLSDLSLNVTTDGASDTKYPSVKAVKTYADAITAALSVYQTIANLSTNVTTDGASNTKYPSVKAIKDYVDARIPASTAHSSTTGLQGGTSGQYYHLTSAQHTVVTRPATALQSGYLSAADFATFSALSGAIASTLVTTQFEILEVSNKLVVRKVSDSTVLFSISLTGEIKQAADEIAFTTP